MKKPIVYLSGPIAGLSVAHASSWRNIFKTIYGEEFCLDPMRTAYKHEVIENQHVISDEVATQIVKDDYADIAAADALVVYYTKPSVGTSMEIMLAHRTGKPVVTVNASGLSREQLSPWLRHHTTAMVASLSEAVGAILFIQSQVKEV